MSKRVDRVHRMVSYRPSSVLLLLDVVSVVVIVSVVVVGIVVDVGVDDDDAWFRFISHFCSYRAPGLRGSGPFARAAPHLRDVGVGVDVEVLSTLCSVCVSPLYTVYRILYFLSLLFNSFILFFPFCVVLRLLRADVRMYS